MLKIDSRQIFNNGIPILLRWHLYIEMAPRSTYLYITLFCLGCLWKSFLLMLMMSWHYKIAMKIWTFYDNIFCFTIQYSYYECGIMVFFSSVCVYICEFTQQNFPNFFKVQCKNIYNACMYMYMYIHIHIHIHIFHITIIPRYVPRSVHC